MPSRGVGSYSTRSCSKSPDTQNKNCKSCNKHGTAICQLNWRLEEKPGDLCSVFLAQSQAVLIVRKRQPGQPMRFICYELWFLVLWYPEPSCPLAALDSIHRAERHSCPRLCFSRALPPASFDHGSPKVTCNALICRFNFYLLSGVCCKS